MQAGLVLAVMVGFVVLAVAVVLVVLLVRRGRKRGDLQPSGSSVEDPADPSLPEPGGSADGACDAKAALAKHNEYRTRHGRSPLKWDDKLAKSAQKKADGCKFKHEGAMLDGKLVGENLAWATPRNFTCANAIQGMYVTEDKPKGSDRNLADGGINHVTQILWPSATKVGCGVARCPDLGNNIACHYDEIQSKRR